MTQEVLVSHEETLHDGTAQSVMNEETLRNSSGRPDNVNSQEVARSGETSKFRHGKRWNRNGIVCRIKIIRKSGEWSSAEQKNFQCCRRWRRTFYDLVNVYGCTNGIRISKNNRNSNVNTEDLTLKQMFDISGKLVTEQEDISGLETIGWENHSWKFLSLIGDERVFNLQRTKVHVFSDSVLCLGKQKLGMDPIFSKLQKFWQNRWWANGSRVEHFPRIQYVAAQWRSQMFTVEIRWDTKEFHKKNSIYVNVQRHFLWNKRQWRNTRLVFLYAGRSGKGQWSFIGPGEDSPQGIWDKIAERMLVEFAESDFPIFRATTPLSRGRLRRTW